jgi:hypothetical protein
MKYATTIVVQKSLQHTAEQQHIVPRLTDPTAYYSEYLSSPASVII